MTDLAWAESIALENYARVIKVAYWCAEKRHIDDPEGWAAEATESVFLAMHREAETLRRHGNIAAWLFCALLDIADAEVQFRTENKQQKNIDSPTGIDGIRQKDRTILQKGGAKHV